MGNVSSEDFAHCKEKCDEHRGEQRRDSDTAHKELYEAIRVAMNTRASASVGKLTLWIIGILLTCTSAIGMLCLHSYNKIDVHEGRQIDLVEGIQRTLNILEEGRRENRRSVDELWKQMKMATAEMKRDAVR